MDKKKVTKLVKQKKLKFSTRRIGIEVVIMKKLYRDKNASVQGKWFE